MTCPAVEVCGATKTFPIPFTRRSIVAVRNLNLRVERGEIYGLLGPNGSGKSTTLKMILGLITPTSGTANIFGRPSAEVASHEAVGFLPENPYFYKFLTGAETLQFYGKLCGLRREGLPERIAELLELVGLAKAGNRHLRGYSKGMLQRIGLAQALIHNPPLLVLDEPTAGVDPTGARDIRDLVLRLKSRGVTILLSSHLLGQVQEICDRVGILAEGSMVREGRLDDLLGVQNVSEVRLANASEKLLGEVAQLAELHGARVIGTRASRTTLEQLFLDATGSSRENGSASDSPSSSNSSQHWHEEV